MNAKNAKKIFQVNQAYNTMSKVTFNVSVESAVVQTPRSRSPTRFKMPPRTSVADPEEDADRTLMPPPTSAGADADYAQMPPPTSAGLGGMAEDLGIFSQMSSVAAEEVIEGSTIPQVVCIHRHARPVDDIVPMSGEDWNDAFERRRTQKASLISQILTNASLKTASLMAAKTKENPTPSTN